MEMVIIIIYIANYNEGEVVMIVCVCQSVSDKTIKKLVLEKNITNFREIKRCTALGSQCGKCVKLAKDVVDEILSEQYLEAC